MNHGHCVHCKNKGGLLLERTIIFMSYKNAIRLKCKDCNFDPASAGTELEQSTACENGGCALHDLRPMPRHCRMRGVIDKDAVAAIRAKVEAANRARSRR